MRPEAAGAKAAAAASLGHPAAPQPKAVTQPRPKLGVAASAGYPAAPSAPAGTKVASGHPPAPKPKPPSAAAAPARSRETRLPRPPLPRQSECRSYDTYFVSPLDVHFTQDSVSEIFSSQDDDPTKQPSLLETAAECIKDGIPEKIEILDVIWYEGKVYVAGSFNRRLCVYRLLSIFAGLRTMKVRFQPERNREKLFKFASGKNRFTTECEGNWVLVRPIRSSASQYVGKKKQADAQWHTDSDYWYRYDPGVIWPDALKTFDKLLKSKS